MPKRTRDESLDDEDDNTRFKRRATQSKRVAEKFHHHKKLLSRALKTAKGFERQKLGRRRKTALKDNAADVVRIDAEIDALKALDLVQTAEDYLCKIIQKDKALSANEDLARYVAEHKRNPPSQPAVNVTARLYNSNPIKEAVTEVLQSLRMVLGIKKTKKNDESKGGKGAAHMEEDNSDHVRVRQDGRNKLPKDVQEGEESLVSMEGDDSGGEEGADGAYQSDGDELEADMDGRVASASEDESVDLEVPHASARRPSVSELSLSSYSGEASKAPKKAKGNKARTAAPVSSSTFLPSLSMGGYWSGSESEPEDDIEEVAPRKNRRGQRARQQIWEMKFGQKAKHLQSTQKIGKGRGDGWDAKRGAQAADDRGGWRGGGSSRSTVQSSGGGRFASGGNATAVAPRKGTASAEAATAAAGGQKSVGNGKGLGEMHPSWLAAKKAKQEKQTAAFAGSRVTFS